MGLIMQFILYINFKITLVFLCLLNLLLIFYYWSRDIVRERSYLRFHNSIVKKNIKLRIIFFIISEIIFFFRIFWSLIHSALSISVDFFFIWPPKRVIIINPLRIPLLNTILLLLSGYTITISHYSLIKNYMLFSSFHLILTIILRIVFMFIQFLEYKNTFFNFSSSIYRSCFFLSTRFHRLHVFLGLLLLTICIFRILFRHFTNKNHILFECSIWYWHFVDVVWIFLYLVLYCWASL